MKPLMIVSVILLVGCATTPTMKNVAGIYEGKKDGNTLRIFLLENAVAEEYIDGKKQNNEGEAKWKVVNGEIHIVFEHGGIGVVRINIDGSITGIAYIKKGEKRKDVSKDKQITLKIIKSETKESPTKGDDKNSTPATLEDKVVGTYEIKGKDAERTLRYIFLENGVVEGYIKGERWKEAKWSINKEVEIHIEEKEWIEVFRINKDGSITIIGGIAGGKRIDLRKEEQYTFKKIK